MSWDQIGFSENLIREELITKDTELIDSSIFDQNLEFNTIDGSKITGVISSRNGNLKIDLEKEFISLIEAGEEKIRLGIQSDGSFDYKFLKDDLTTLFSKNGLLIPSQYRLIRAGFVPLVVINNGETIEMTGADLNFTLEEDSFVIVTYSVNARSNSATVEGRVTIRLDGSQFTVGSSGIPQSTSSYVLFGTSSGTGRLIQSNPEFFRLNKGAHLIRFAVRTSGGAGDTVTIDSFNSQIFIFGK